MSTRAARKSKGIYGQWTEEAMMQAIAAIKNGTMSKKKASKNFKIPKPTLLRHLNNTNKVAKSGKKHSGRQTDLPEELENQLAKYIIDMEARFYGLTEKSLKELAFKLAKANNIATRFNQEKEMAGKEWLSGFLKRYPEISLRLPEATSLTRATGFNRIQVNRFFELLEKTIEENNITANNIYNVDESGLTVVQKMPKILAKKGKRQVGSIKSQERGSNITIICCMNALGNFVPPGMIFPRVRMKAELQDGAPPGSVFYCQVSKGLRYFSVYLICYFKH